jgi:hypothetical protein
MRRKRVRELGVIWCGGEILAQRIPLLSAEIAIGNFRGQRETERSPHHG